MRHIPTGDLLRGIKVGEIESAFSDQVVATDTISSLPDGVVNGVVFEALGSVPDNAIALTENYPRYERNVPLVHQAIQSEGHDLLGVIYMNVTRETSLTRLSTRSPRKGEDPKSESSLSFDYHRHQTTTHMAIRALMSCFGYENVREEHIDASGSEADVARLFRLALGKLATGHAELEPAWEQSNLPLILPRH